MATKKGQLRKTSRRAYEGKRRSYRASPKLKKTEASLARARASLRKARDASKSAYKTPVGEAAAITAGGALAGGLDAYMPEIMGFDSALVGGVALVAGALVMDAQGQKVGAGMASCIGGGMLAAWASGFTADMLGGS
jgi:hypothetical protein